MHVSEWIKISHLYAIYRHTSMRRVAATLYFIDLSMSYSMLSTVGNESPALAHSLGTDTGIV